jgi:hypothetical protein
MNVVSLDHNHLLKQYLDVCHQAMISNKNRFPFKQILSAAKKAGTGNTIEINITDTSSKNSYVLKLQNEGVSLKPHGNCQNCKCDRKWLISEEYLQEVVKQPEIYIQNPAKLNWEWMYDTQH